MTTSIKHTTLGLTPARGYSNPSGAGQLCRYRTSSGLGTCSNAGSRRTGRPQGRRCFTLWTGSVAFGAVTVVLELAFPELVLAVLLNIVGSTCLLVWTSALLAQLALRLRADREGTALPLRMPGFPWLICFGLLILAAIFTVGFIGEDSRSQLLSTFGLVAVLAVGCWVNHRGGRKVAPAVEPSEPVKPPVIID